MRISTILLAGAFAILSTAVLAQSNSSEKTQKSMTGDPAAELGLNQSVKLLEATLAEEKKTDETLTQLAESEVNQHAEAA